MTSLPVSAIEITLSRIERRKTTVRRDCDLAFMLRYSVLLVLALFASACATKVIEIDKSVPKLGLSREQSEVVEPKMMAIKEIADTYDSEKEEFDEEMSNSMDEVRSGGGDRSQRRGKFQELRKKRGDFLKKRESYLSAIKIHVADIKAVLNEEQLARFGKMKLPELEEPETPGGGQRRGTGGRGEGTGGRGGGGRRGGRGGGTF